MCLCRLGRPAWSTWTVLGLDRDSSAWRRLSTPPPAAPAALNQAGPVSPSLSVPDQPGNPKLLSQRLRLQTGSDSSQQDYWTAFFVFFAGLPAKTEVVDNKDGTHTVTYVPLTSGMYTLLLTYGGQTVPGFPARVMVDPAVDTSKVKVFGPGLEGPGEGPPERPHRRDTNPRVQPQLALSLSPLMQPSSERPPRTSRWTLVLCPRAEGTT